MDQVFKRDSTRFRTYIQATTAHGVVHIFTEPTFIRKLVWLVIVLGAATGCLYNCIDRIMFWASKPTSTTIMIARKQEMDFPAVTICNLNILRKDYLESVGLETLIRDSMFIDFLEPEGIRSCNAQLERINVSNITYQSLLEEGKDALQNLIASCHFQGRPCSIDNRNFSPTMTRFGVCYTFNSGKGGTPIHKAHGTGSRLGLRLMVNVSQDQYVATTNYDAGVKIAVHHQSDPPQPDNHGIAAPTGKSAFVSIEQFKIVDKTKRNCKSRSEASGLNFVLGEYNYSHAACVMDCYYTQVADACGCILANTFVIDKNAYKHLELCSISQICCVLAQQFLVVSCNCLPSCSTNSYSLSSSYSLFPADYIAVGRFKNVSSNMLAASIYYKTLSVREEVTSFSYNIVSLLSDIGGQLGLFLGISVISVVELVSWVIDEINDRCVSASLKKMKQCCDEEKENDDETLMLTK